MNNEKIVRSLVSLAIVATLTSSCDYFLLNREPLNRNVGLYFSNDNLIEMQGEPALQTVLREHPQLRQRYILFQHARRFSDSPIVDLDHESAWKTCHEIRILWGADGAQKEHRDDCEDRDGSLSKTALSDGACRWYNHIHSFALNCKSCDIVKECVQSCLSGQAFYSEPSWRPEYASRTRILGTTSNARVTDDRCTSGRTSVTTSTAGQSALSLPTEGDCRFYCAEVELDRIRCESNASTLGEISQVDNVESSRVLRALEPAAFLLSADGERYLLRLQERRLRARELAGELNDFLDSNAKRWSKQDYFAFQAWKLQEVGQVFIRSFYDYEALVRLKALYQSFMRKLESTCAH